VTAGNVDMEPDEIQAAIDRAEAKRRERLEAQPAAKESVAIPTAAPKNAELCCEQSALGLDKTGERRRRRVTRCAGSCPTTSG